MATKKKTTNLVLMNFKVTKAEKRIIEANAKAATRGNVSQFLRTCSTRPVRKSLPKKVA